MYLKSTLTIALLVLALLMNAQDNTLSTVNSATMVGVGHASLTDTYLSPMPYRGSNLSIMSERLGKAGFINDKLLMRYQFYLTTAFTKNPASSASEYYGDVSYNAMGYYPVWGAHNFRLLAGAGIDASLGGIYNDRNTNNPGSLKTSLNLEVGAMALYNFKMLTLRWQGTTPFAGMFFTPGYGQSYYEIFSLGNGDGTVQFASFNNYLAFQNYFTVDIPIKKLTLRAGYLGNYYRTDVNHLETKIVTHQFMIGFAVESMNFGGKKVRNSRLIDSVYY